MGQALVIGAGPSGLMAADVLSGAGHAVTVADAKPSVGRKLLMAGKSGLNLTKSESLDLFLSHYQPANTSMLDIVRAFGPDAVQEWAKDLGQPVFTGSSGRVFPTTMKSSPLMRAWLARLASQEVEVRTRWRWRGWQDEAWVFDTPSGQEIQRPDVTVLALGGASWARLGSDGMWSDLLRSKQVEITPFRASNVGLRVDWSDHMTRHFGAPVKGVALTCGDRTVRGEFVISTRGLEGGGIYAIGTTDADSRVFIDLMPDWSEARITERLSLPRGKTTAMNHVRKALKLGPEKLALLAEFGRPWPADADLARRIKALPVAHLGPRPMDEAISTAGGISWTALDGNLMLKTLPGIFAAGEMLDWDAPTGGYLMTGCLATGRWAGQAAVDYLAAAR